LILGPRSVLIAAHPVGRCRPEFPAETGFTMPTSQVQCPLCEAEVPKPSLKKVGDRDRSLIERIKADHPEWQRESGSCPACVQHYLLEILEKEGAAAHDAIQAHWPIDAEAVFGVLPTPLRMKASPRFTGKGVTVAVLDSGFFPHPDLIEPKNRIRAYVAIGLKSRRVHDFKKSDTPKWPGSAQPNESSWHGMMTSVTVAGNGRLSKGLYRSLAPEAEVVLVKVAGPGMRIGDRQIQAGLEWVVENHKRYDIKIVNLSLGGDRPLSSRVSKVDQLVEKLTEEGVVCVVAAGNGGRRRLVPPGSAPSAITVGGLDDKNTFERDEWTLWHANWGPTADGVWKPEIVAPSIWVVAPILPTTSVAREAAVLTALQKANDRKLLPLVRKAPAPIRTWRYQSTDAIRALIAQRMAELKLVTTYYQHVDGTSFASPIVASLVAQLVEANPNLTPKELKSMLVRTAERLSGVDAERQGGGIVNAAAAVAEAVRRASHAVAKKERPLSPAIGATHVEFFYGDDAAQKVEVIGDFNQWKDGATVMKKTAGVWRARIARPTAGAYRYKLRIDGEKWREDPENGHKEPDGFGGFNSLLRLS
jgi:serine protease AprX